MRKLNFLSKQLVKKILNNTNGSAHVYSYDLLLNNIEKLKNFPNAYGLQVRYAIKANPHKSILSTLNKYNIHFDASSEYETMTCLNANIPASHIQLTSQQFPQQFKKEIFSSDVLFNACSLHQLEEYGKAKPNSEVSFRINPGLGSGSTKKTNVGGPSSAFGIWHQQIQQIKNITQKYNLKITRMHSHIGSGSNPKIWEKVAQMNLQWLNQFPFVHTLNLGGGFKVGRMPDEKTTCLQETGNYVKKAFESFYNQTGRKIKLEIEPGTYMIANIGSIIAQVQDISNTGKNGFNFLKLNIGMDSITRPALYTSAHPIIILNDSSHSKEYVVAGHCCESSDIFTLDDKENLKPRLLPLAQINDPVVIEYTGAYCASMSLKNYNSFPALSEWLIKDNQPICITPEQKFEQIAKDCIDINA